MQEALLQAGCQLPEVKKIDAKTPPHVVKGNILIAPPGSDGGPWLNAFSPYSVGVCSGWTQVRNGWRNRTADSGFALSDHADWDGLISAVKATGASKVFVTHGFQRVFSRWLNENGIESAEVKTEYSAGEEEQDIETKNEN